MKTQNLTPWSNLYLGESKFNIPIKASCLYVIFYGWGCVFLLTICILLITPLKYFGFILLAALCSGLVFYKWTNVWYLRYEQRQSEELHHEIQDDKKSLKAKVFNASLSKISYLSLSAEKNNGSCEVSVYERLTDKTSEKHQQQVLKGEISPRSRTSFIGVWITIEIPSTPYTSHLNNEVKKVSTRSFFLFQDNMNLPDYKRICRMIHYVQYSAP